MGQQSSLISEANRLYEMPLSQYRLKERLNLGISIWKHKNQPYQQLIDNRMVVNTVDDLEVIYDIFKMRHLHMYLSSTCYLTCDHQGIKGCGEYYKVNIYLEWPITTLAMINDIPFFDSLHMFAVAVRGFEILYRKFGYFDIFQDMFHICENGKLKVWCNSQVYKLGPQPYLLDSTGKEDDMLYRIINIIDENVDKSQTFNLKRILYAKISTNSHFQSFQQANHIFRQVCKQNNWQPPQRLKCISHSSREEIQKMLNFLHESQQKVSSPSNTVDNFGTKRSLNQQKVANQGKKSVKASPRLVQKNQSSRQNRQLINQNHKPNVNGENNINNFRYFGKQQSIQPIQRSFEQYSYIPITSIPNSNVGKVPQCITISRQQTPQVSKNQHVEQVGNRVEYKIYSNEKNNHNSRQNSLQKLPTQPPTQNVQQFINVKQHYHFPNKFVYPNQPFISNNRNQNKVLVNTANQYQIFPNSYPPLPPTHKLPQCTSYQKPITKYCQVQSRIIQPANVGKPYYTNNMVQLPKSQIQNGNRITNFMVSNPLPICQGKYDINKQILQPQCQQSAEKQQNLAISKGQMQTVSNLTQTPKYQGKSSRANEHKQVSQDIWKINIQNNIKRQQHNGDVDKSKQKSSQQPLKINQKNSNFDKIKSLQKYQSDFTDPFLLEHLSTVDKSTSSVTPSTFSNVGCHRDLHSEIKTWESHVSNQNQVPLQSQMLYSFSQNMKNPLPKKQEVPVNCSQAQQAVINSQSSSIALRRYETGIDKEIWKDLVELKKNKNLY